MITFQQTPKSSVNFKRYKCYETRIHKDEFHTGKHDNKVMNAVKTKKTVHKYLFYEGGELISKLSSYKLESMACVNFPWR